MPSTNVIVAALAGLLAGSAHVLTGPDHVAAVAPLAIAQRRRVWRTGLSWGIGHSSGVWLIGLLALALRGVLPVDALSAWSEGLVGIVLIAIGLWGLHKVLAARVHVHQHTHDGQTHAHVHVHAGGTDHALDTPHHHSHAAFAVGLLHGVAGTSHLLGVLPSLALPTAGAALGYLVAFGLGSIAAMTAFAWALGAVTARLVAVRVGLYRSVLGASCLAAIGVGCVWLVWE